MDRQEQEKDRIEKIRQLGRPRKQPRLDVLEQNIQRLQGRVEDLEYANEQLRERVAQLEVACR